MADKTQQTSDRNVKHCSDLRKGDFAWINHDSCEVLAAFVLDADRFVVKARNIVTGREFEVKDRPTERTELFTPTFKDYILLDFDFDHALLMDVKDGTRPESVKVPEGKMGEDMKKLYESSEKGVGVTVIENGWDRGVHAFKESTGE